MSEPISSGTVPEPSNSTRRQRAPTITIDTSAALAANDLEEETDSGPRPLSVDTAVAESRGAHSFESSRPTSPHNVSSPAKWGPPRDLLQVPHPVRSRGNSVDSDEDLARSPTSYGGETFLPSSNSSQNDDASRGLDSAHSGQALINDKDALKPDPGTEEDFDVEDNRFAFSPGQLNKLIDPKSLSAFRALGGLRGIERGLRTDRDTGLSLDETRLEGTVTMDEVLALASDRTSKTRQSIRRKDSTKSFTKTPESFQDRLRIYRDNRLPEKKGKTIFELAWLAYNDKVLILLTVAAIISLALGIYQSITAKDGEARVQWVEGVAIIVAILIVVVVGAANDWQKERQFVKLNKKKEDRSVKVIRSGKSREISVYDLLVGDVVHLEPGDLIPVDGIFIAGHGVKCDEASATGEFDLLKKTPADDVYRAIENNEPVAKLDPFILSGAKVNEGTGTFLVTSIGVNSSYGKTLMSLREDAQTTPLQSKLNVLAEYIAKLGLAAGLFLFVVTFIEFCVRLQYITGGASAKGQAFLNVFIVAVTIIVVAVPEGLPLAVTLALAFATTRMLKDNNLVRLLRSCETMGNATTICSDKTGTLTQNKMTVVAGTIGLFTRFGDKAPENGQDDSTKTPKTSQTGLASSSIPAAMKSMDSTAQDVLCESIFINTTAFEGEMDGQQNFIGSKTETALLMFARDYLALGPLTEARANTEVVQVEPFDSGRKCMATVVKIDDKKYRLYVKGASEIMLEHCTKVVTDAAQGLVEEDLTAEVTEQIKETINSYASRSLRTIGFLYKEFDSWPPRGYPVQKDDPKYAVFDKVFKEMTFLGVVGIQDPLRPGVTEAVKDCQMAGVFVRMVTGDNMMTAKAIATECGIYTTGGIIMEGPEFRKMTKKQMNQTIPKLQVLARSSPQDKKTLVKRLKELGETVAVTGDGTNDAPALKTADVGFSMGIAGTEVAKEASAIILMDDNFASIVKAMMWGRAVNDSVKKFLQFQVTVNITAVFLTFISAVASPDETSVLTAVQLLWVNLIMDTFAALALATDAPTRSILDRKPEPKSAPLITLTMWKMIIGQSLFQLVVTLVLYFAGTTLTGYSGNYLQTLVFNTFVWMQIFNQYNCRRLDNKFNIFEGMFSNYFFLGIQIIIVAGQVLIVFVGDRAFSVTRQSGPAWGIALVLGLISIPAGMLIRLIPDSFVRKCIPKYFERKATPEVVIEDAERGGYEWNPALEEIKQELAFIKMVRGGRLNLLRYKLAHPRELLPRSRSGSRSRTSSVNLQTPNNETAGDGSASIAPPSPDRRSLGRRRGRSRSNSAFGPAAAMAGIVAGSIAGWSPIDRRDGDAFGRFVPLSDRSDLEATSGVEVHPDAKKDDPVLADWEGSLKAPSPLPETTPTFGATLGVPELGHRRG